MDKQKLDEVLKKHEQWVRDEEGGARANLRCADLRAASLRWANLRRANLRVAKLHGADLYGANLSGADLRWSDLRWSDLRRADLSGADLRGANLRWSDLRRAGLSGADLSGADLSDADLSGANFMGAKGFLLLPVQDTRGYSFAHAIETDEGWRIRAGCRDFSIEDAREHWGAGYKGDREQGDLYLYAVDWIEKKLQEGE